MGKINAVINLKKKSITVLKTIFLSLVFGTIFFVAGFFYLDSRLENMTVSEKTESVPYYSVPSDATVLINICEDSILVNLKFEEEKINIVFVDGNEYDYGYTVDYNLNCNYELVGYLVDISGGIEIDGLRQTGIQITEMLQQTLVKNSQKRAITEAIVDGIADSSFTKEDLLFIIENSENDLKFNECYFWTNYISKLCKFPCYIN